MKQGQLFAFSPEESQKKGQERKCEVWRPYWWVFQDELICVKYHDWKRIGGRLPDCDIKEFNCRRCKYWQSDDGATGTCNETTVKELAGQTSADDTCEMWEPLG